MRTNRQTEEDTLSQQNDLATCDIPTPSHVTTAFNNDGERNVCFIKGEGIKDELGVKSY